MSGTPTHDELRDSLAAEALGALHGPEREALLVHLAGCEECARELAGMRDTAGELAFAVPSVALDPDRSARLRARLVARAAADARPREDAAGTPVTPLRRGPAP
ncbi:MAG: hypothetical protein ABW277_09640, partial [Longimicrobiaceae bacterium]